ncbi:hypothetical protein LCGC14_1903080 [marine sediment metagenome]|uniref:Uncharacterized protein n=1 Tax=marine sediment metagenome TaxID=412755 RepID=A0A0F9I9X2_9ZZZZ
MPKEVNIKYFHSLVEKTELLLKEVKEYELNGNNAGLISSANRLSGFISALKDLLNEGEEFEVK